MKIIRAFLLFVYAAAAMLAQQPTVQAQQILPLVVSACGTLPFTYTAGQRQTVTIDANGVLCVPGASSASPVITNEIDVASYTGTVASGVAYTITPANGTLGSITTDGYNEIVYQPTAIGNAANRLRIETSNDNANWTIVEYGPASSVSATPSGIASSIAPSLTQILIVPVTGRYVRFFETGFTGGTDTFQVYLRKNGARGPVVASQGVGNTNTPWYVLGNVVSGAADNGPPVKTGCVFNTTAPTVTNAQRVDCQANNRGAPLVENGPYLLGRATADVQIKGSAGFIHTVSIAALTATPTAGLLTIYDSLTETGTVVYAEWIFATDVGHTITLDIPCATGIFVGFDATLASVQATLAYR